MLDKSRPLTRKRKTVKVEVAQLGQPRHILKAVGPRECDTGDSPRPDAKVWNRRRKRFVRRDLVSRVYYQFGGRRIDLNKNGVDDAIDIAFFKALDRNGDVLDPVQR